MNIIIIIWYYIVTRLNNLIPGFTNSSTTLLVSGAVTLTFWSGKVSIWPVVFIPTSNRCFFAGSTLIPNRLAVSASTSIELVVSDSLTL